MATFVVLTRLTPETVPAPEDLATLEKTVADRIRKGKWVAN